VFENAAWAPIRSVLPETVDLDEAGDEQVEDPVAAALSQAVGARLTGAEPALPVRDGFTDFSGPVEAGQTIYQGTGPFGGWSLTVDGEEVDARPAFGFGSAFTVESSGEAKLSYERDLGRVLLLLAQIAAWCYVLFRLARRRARSGGIA
ncbi:MAG: hypothetical protein AAGK32_20195, partial [Actinomycetota bacterium]